MITLPDNLKRFNLIIKPQQTNTSKLIFKLMIDKCIEQYNTKCTIIVPDRSCIEMFFTHISWFHDIKKVKKTKNHLILENGSEIRIFTNRCNIGGMSDIIYIAEAKAIKESVVNDCIMSLSENGMLFVDSSFPKENKIVEELCNREDFNIIFLSQPDNELSVEEIL